MENPESNNGNTERSGSFNYRYWVRQVTEEAAPLPVHRKLSAQDLSNRSQPSTPQLGSVWNTAGTWEEKNLNKWASERIKDLVVSVGSIEFAGGKAEIAEVSKCVGDAFMVTVRNKKRVGYNYELTLRVKGECLIGEEKKNVVGHIDIPEFSFGDLDDLQIEVRVSDEKDLLHQQKLQVTRDLKKLFLEPLRKKLLQFEQELKER
jgi:activator of HSP90 ATPase